MLHFWTPVILALCGAHNETVDDLWYCEINHRSDEIKEDCHVTARFLTRRMTIQFAAYLFRVLTGAYAISVLGFLLLHWTIGERSGLVALLNSLAYWLLLPAAILLPVSLLMQRRDLVVLLLPIVAVFGMWYTPYFLPRVTADVPETAPHLRVMTYNTLSMETQGEDLARVIRDADADVVALQELSDRNAAYLAAALADEYPYQQFSTFRRTAVGGKGILSRYPITRYETWKTHLVHQRADLDVYGTTVTLLNVHAPMPLSTGFDRRNADVQAIQDYAQQITDHPVILVGDFNSTPHSEPYNQITNVYRDAFAQMGQGFGFSFTVRDIPIIRIDYVFHTADLVTLDAAVLPDRGGSDHHPLRATLALNGHP